MDIKGWPGPEDEGMEDGPARMMPPVKKKTLRKTLRQGTSSVKPWSQDMECSDSICGYEAFQQTLHDFFHWKTALNNYPIRVFEDEMSLEYQQLVKAESASREALLTVIDTYCAYRCARVFLPDEK